MSWNPFSSFLESILGGGVSPSPRGVVQQGVPIQYAPPSQRISPDRTPGGRPLSPLPPFVSQGPAKGGTFIPPDEEAAILAQLQRDIDNAVATGTLPMARPPGSPPKSDRPRAAPVTAARPTQPNPLARPAPLSLDEEMLARNVTALRQGGTYAGGATGAPLDIRPQAVRQNDDDDDDGASREKILGFFDPENMNMPLFRIGLSLLTSPTDETGAQAIGRALREEEAFQRGEAKDARTRQMEDIGVGLKREELGMDREKLGIERDRLNASVREIEARLEDQDLDRGQRAQLTAMDNAMRERLAFLNALVAFGTRKPEKEDSLRDLLLPGDGPPR